MIELVVPLAITVLVVQNGQGIAVLAVGRPRGPRQRGHPGVRGLVFLLVAAVGIGLHLLDRTDQRAAGGLR